MEMPVINNEQCLLGVLGLRRLDGEALLASGSVKTCHPSMGGGGFLFVPLRHSTYTRLLLQTLGNERLTSPNALVWKNLYLPCACNMPCLN